MYKKIWNTQNKRTGMNASGVTLKKSYGINAVEIVENDISEAHWKYGKHHKYSIKYSNNSNFTKYKI